MLMLSPYIGIQPPLYAVASSSSSLFAKRSPNALQFFDMTVTPLTMVQIDFADGNNFSALGSEVGIGTLYGVNLSTYYRNGTEHKVRFSGSDANTDPNTDIHSSAFTNAAAAAPHSLFLPMQRAWKASITTLKKLITWARPYARAGYFTDLYGWQSAVPWNLYALDTERCTSHSCWFGAEKYVVDTGTQYDLMNNAYTALALFDALAPRNLAQIHPDRIILAEISQVFDQFPSMGDAPPPEIKESGLILVGLALLATAVAVIAIVLVQRHMSKRAFWRRNPAPRVELQASAILSTT